MAEWASYDVPLEGVTLRIYRTNGGKPPVVLAHGFADSGLFWTAVAQALEAQFELIMYDARGHGLSPLPAEGMGTSAMVEDLANLIRALGLDRPALMGHSMGAGTVAGLAVAHPELTRGIVLEDPGWRDPTVAPMDMGAFRQRIRDEVQRYRKISREEVIADCQARHPLWPAVQCGAWADARLQLDPRILEGLGGLGGNWRETARAIACPVLLVTADVDRGGIVTPEVAAEAKTLLKRGQVVHIGGAGHAIRSDQLGLFVQTVTPFLAGLYAQ